MVSNPIYAEQIVAIWQELVSQTSFANSHLESHLFMCQFMNIATS